MNIIGMVEDLIKENKEKTNRIEAYKMVESQNQELISDLINYINYLEGKLSVYKNNVVVGVDNERSARYISRLSRSKGCRKYSRDL